ncbi:TonB-dependent receptor domain-containing protein [Telluribacter sp.]|uniref:TonB-dependent receptor domain-containing protein n=1 Tax=Telluribacter sp. TaxID=1978767 RepID=UPI002E106EB4|nr:TonB-dependent receptor [Telluribacter sp.]
MGLKVFGLVGALIVAVPAIGAVADNGKVSHRESRKDQGKILGKVVEGNGKDTPASFATVALLRPDSTVISGTMADENGVFLIPEVAPGNYLLRITLMGYDTRFVPNVNVATEASTTDLGIIPLTSAVQSLNEVVIRGEKTMIVNDIDKKIVNVGKDLLATSNNASEILEKVPSVSMDENGNPMLRGKGNVVVLIDGKPSTLYGNDLPTVLQSFPAELIERIDVMTTPSAKYEGEGASGVIDIITKKSRIRGTNGSIRASLANDWNSNASGYINYKAGKWALRASGNAQNRVWMYRRALERENFLGETPTLLEQSGTGRDRNQDLFGRLGVNYDINDKNSLGLSFNISRDNRFNNSFNHNETRLPNGEIIQQFDRISNGNSHGNNINANFDYRRVFSDNDHVLTFTANYSEGASEGYSEFDQRSDEEELARRQRNLRDNNRKSLFLNTDYSWPVTTRATLEVGVRSRLNSRQSNNAFYTFDPYNELYSQNLDASNRFGYSDAIHTGYMTFTQKSDLWGIRGGLRLSDATQNINQISRQQAFSVHFLNLVPSLALTRKLDDESQLKLNYSRRVQRPQADWLNPFTDISDPRNIQSGNPNLRPEFTHKAEVGYSSYEQKGGWGPSLFADYSNNAITRIRTIDEAGISYTQFANVGRELAYGFETDVSHQLGEKVKVNASGRVFRSEVVSAAANIDSRIWTYSGNLNAFVQLPYNVRASAYLNYDGPRAIAQGTRQGVFVANMGVRKDLLDRKATLSLNMQDLLLSRIYKNELRTDNYIQNSLWQRTNRYVGLTFQYKFGRISADASGDDA